MQRIKKIIISLWLISLSIMSIFFVPTRYYEEYVLLDKGSSYKMAIVSGNTNIYNLNYCEFYKSNHNRPIGRTQELNVSAYLMSVVAITLVFASIYSIVCIFGKTGPNTSGQTDPFLTDPTGPNTYSHKKDSE